jgi:tetratricopeptide (TPR) repeat protein
MSPRIREFQLTDEQRAELSQLPRVELEAILASDPHLVRASVVEQLGEAVRRLVRLDPNEALRCADVAVAIATRLVDSAALGRAFRAKANALWYAGNLKDSVTLFEAARERFESAASWEEVGRTLSSSIQPLALLGDYARAFEAAERARAIFLQFNDDLRMARLEINVANIHHRQDRFREALASYQRAYERLLPHNDTEGIAAALHNMAVCLIGLNDFDEALRVYRRARELSESSGMPRVAAQADYNIAYLYFLRGDFQVAIDRLEATREVCRRTGDDYHAALCDLDQSEIYLELNLAEDASRVAQQAQSRFETLQMSFETGRSVVNRAIAAHLLGESAAASSLFVEAAAIFSKEGNRAWQALIGLYRALVLLESGQAGEAEALCRASLAYFEDAGLERRAILSRLLLARVAESNEAWAVAGEHCRGAIRRLKAVEAPLLRCQAHALLGRISTAQGDTNSAYRCFQKARRDLENLRSSLQGEELKIAFMKNRSDVYEGLVGICLQRRGSTAAETAFRYLEEAKSRALLDTMYGRATPRFCPGVSGAKAARIESLRQELNWCYRRLEVEQTRPDSIPIARIDDLRRQASRLERDLERAFRDSDATPAGAPFETSCSTDLTQVRAALGPDASLLEYFQVGDRFVAAVVNREGVRLQELCRISDVAASIRLLEFQLSPVRVNEAESADVQRLLIEAVNSRLRGLYRHLVEPVAASLIGTHVVVVPHGILHCLPFHAFKNGESSYLIDCFSISYAPSAAIYSVCEGRRNGSSGSALLMGVRSSQTPCVEDEISAVAAVVPDTDVRLGSDATAQALAEAGPSSRLIHVATHGTFRRDNPMFSSFRLADSYITMYDLYRMRLPVRLLTLSGCGTGLNVVAAGDELLGLMRGVLFAGAESLVASLWNVHDRSTAEFMAAFYSHLGDGDAPAQALRRAMLDLRRSHPHPYHWAPFMLVGKPARQKI